MTKYSICITHFNNYVSLKKSLDSLLNQIDDDFEVIIVDNNSNDGSQKILEGYQELKKIRLIKSKCTRGQGRQLALQNSKGEYIISNMDMDDLFEPVMKKFVNLYHSEFEGYILLAISKDNPNKGFQNITIGPKKLIENLGGWRDLQFGEDWDLWSRAAKIGKFRYVQFNISSSLIDKRNEKIISHLNNRYIKYREMSRLGRNIFSDEESKSIAQYLIAFIAKLGSIFHESYSDSFNKTFQAYSKEYFHNLSINKEDFSE